MSTSRQTASENPALATGQLGKLVARLAHYLPAQGPIGVFIHHNTLHAFEHLPFEEAVLEGARVFGTQPYMSETAYRRDLLRGRIAVRDIAAVLEEEANEEISAGLDRRALRRAMLVPGVREFEPETVEWRYTEGDLAGSLRPGPARALFDVCLRRTTDEPAARPATGCARPLDNIVHPLLIRLSANYLEQGAVYWPMPHRELGFLGAVRQLMGQPVFFGPAGLDGLAGDFRDQSSLEAAAVVSSKLDELRIEDPETFLRDELLALPGWAGLFHRLEEQPELAPYRRLPCTLMDYLAVRLTLVATAKVNLPEAGERPVQASPSALRLIRVATLFDALAALNFTAESAQNLAPAEFHNLEREVSACHSLERRRLFHLAYERRHEREILSPIGQHRRDLSLSGQPAEKIRPSAQVFFCIDEREESLRRHLEELAPGVRTFGAAGFFGVAMQFTGIDDSHSAPLCPVVMKPAHSVGEQPYAGDEHLHGQRRWRRRVWSRLTHGLYVSSRSLLPGWVSTALLGTISVVPLLVRVLAPRLAGRVRQRLNEAIFPEPRTVLTFESQEKTPANAHEDFAIGFTVQEKIDRVGGMLRGAGLVDNFARLVVVLGHGSASLNNPHESAHDCGACGGRRGGPNGRVFAAMANHPGVRDGLRAQGLDIPADTRFLGGYHDTCSDAIDLYDLEALPGTHAADHRCLREQLDRARALDAHERSRRFETFDESTDPSLALMHVEGRAEHLAQPRPEYGHCTNAVCFVGRRDSVRGLFLDRRTFLVSYDASVDPDDTYLKRQLGAVILVCSGISLEYYFSFVDNEGYGCGTKLPHNVTGLVGLMNGHASDLRTGLPWQMVEIHEPVRILFIIETTPERLEAVIASNAYNANLTKNRWIRLATLHPATGQIHVRRDHGFEPYEFEPLSLPVAASSREWYQGKLHHLPIARIGPR